MGIISRFKDIMEANINAMFDKWEDPEKMIDQYLRNLEKDLDEVKKETASVIAEEKASKRNLDECQAEIDKMTEYAKRAVLSGNDDEARQFLNKKTELESRKEVLSQQYTLSCENSMKMREMHDKLERDIAELKSRREILKAKAKVAETQQKMNNMSSGVSSAGSNMAKFDALEERINRKLDEADAMAELNNTKSSSTVDNLVEKYNDGAKSAAVDAELEALKASLGMTSGESGAQ
ncbi:MAG: PspA/IM30 family protein [Lachnospiraceae bacterium]